MGASAFDLQPDHARVVPERHAILPLASAGLDQRWDMPVWLWEAPTGFGGPPDDHPHHTLTILLSGGPVHRVRASGAVTEHNPRTSTFVCVQPAHRDNIFMAQEATRFAHLYFQPEFLRRAATALHGDAGDREELFGEHCYAENAETRHMAESYLHRALDPTDGPSTLEMDARAALLGLQLVRAHSLLSGRSPRGLGPIAKGGLSPWQVRRVSEYMEARIGGEVSLAELAALVGLSANHFCTAFRQSTGLPPHRYLAKLRIERAKTMLIDPRLSITDIALATGFGSSAYFATAFRKEVGATPSSWRRERGW